jgi:endogenous inhibitor of DNA gyrase (YacG/DUF329 family)
MNCPECKKPIISTPGKRPKKFCSTTCRSNFWQKQKRKEARVRKAFQKFDTPKEQETRRQLTDDLVNQGVAYSKVTTAGTERVDPQSDEATEILKQLRVAEAEKMPGYIQMEIGRIHWSKQQKKKIDELKALYKSKLK